MTNVIINNSNNSNNMETKLVCPKCGAEFAIAEHEHHVSGTALAKDSGLGVVEMPLAKVGKKVNERLDAMKAKGIDVSNYFAIRGANGGEALGRMDNGVLTMVDENDPILKQILEDGDIPNRDLFRRWVMGQMFHALAFKGYGSRDNGGFTDWLRYKGYDYQWKMTLEEFRVQEKLVDRDPENYIARNRWFNKELAVAMIEEDIESLRMFVKNLRTHRCKGLRYVHVDGRDIFVSNLEAKLYAPLRRALDRVKKAGNASQLYALFCSYCSNRVKLPWATQQSKRWIDAYKGVGAYYTMQNLIRFHGCFIITRNGVLRRNDGALKAIDNLAADYSSDKCGYKMLGALKQLLIDNDIDIEKKIAEWRK